MEDRDPPSNADKSLKAPFADSVTLATRWDAFLDDIGIPRSSPPVQGRRDHGQCRRHHASRMGCAETGHSINLPDSGKGEAFFLATNETNADGLAASQPPHHRSGPRSGA